MGGGGVVALPTGRRGKPRGCRRNEEKERVISVSLHLTFMLSFQYTPHPNTTKIITHFVYLHGHLKSLSFYFVHAYLLPKLPLHGADTEVRKFQGFGPVGTPFFFGGGD